MRKGIALVICAPSGAGKSTLSKMLLKEFTNLQFSISCTTRPKRQNEIDGKDYFFLNKTDFEKLRKENKFLEWAEVHGNFYGTLKNTVQTALSSGKDVLFDIDTQGAAQIKVFMEEARFVFILPPSMAELERRLIARGQEDKKNMEVRLLNAKLELMQAGWFDSIIVNDNLAKAYDCLRSIYIAATLAPGHNAELLNSLISQKK